MPPDQILLDTISTEFGELLARDDAGRSHPTIVTATVEHVLDASHIARYVAAHGKLATTEKSDEKDVHVLRARHHQVARLLAAGLGETVIAELTEFTPSYISVLKNNPSMIDLIAHYRAPGAAASEAIAEQLRTAADGAIKKLIAKMGEDQLNNNELLALAKLGLDRSGNGPQSTVNSINEHRVIDVAEVARLALEARQAQAGRVIDIRTVRDALPKAGETAAVPQGEAEARDVGAA